MSFPAAPAIATTGPATKSSDRNPEIPMLTGARGVAALCVLLSHAFVADVHFAAPEPSWLNGVRQMAYLGMSIFFVLSGFVIHYNYSAALASGRAREIWKFFVARFARLYPLYFVVVVADLFMYNYFYLFSINYLDTRATLYEAIPYYIFLLQSWVFHPVAGKPLLAVFPALTQVTWSISTEWFFYCAYPILLIALMRLKTLRTGLIAALALSVVGWTAVVLAHHFQSAIEVFGFTRYGVAARTEGFGFLNWLVYFSPYARILEFLMGCIAASIFLHLRDATVSDHERRWGIFVSLGMLIAFVIFYHSLLVPLPPPHSIRMICLLFFSGAIPVAVLLFCCARYGGPIAAALTWRPIMICGEVSYSIYLLHVVIVQYVEVYEQVLIPNPAAYTGWTLGQALLKVAIVVLLTVGLAIIVHRLLEVPARRVLRRWLTATQTATA